MVVFLFGFFTILISLAHEDYYFRKCFNDFTFGTSIPFQGKPDNYTFRPECAPDVLYSWQKTHKINSESIKKSPLPNKKFLFAWRTPLGTFGYGDTLIRMKLKKNIKYKWITAGQGFRCPQVDQDNTVYVHSYTFGFFMLNAVDYILCSGGPVESWSIGLRGTQIEALKELKFVEENLHNVPQPFDSYSIGYLRSRPIPASVFYKDNPYFISWDYDLGNNWSMQSLRKRIQLIHTGENGQLYCHHSQKCLIQEHMTSDSKSYFILSPSQEKQGFL